MAELELTQRAIIHANTGGWYAACVHAFVTGFAGWGEFGEAVTGQTEQGRTVELRYVLLCDDCRKAFIAKRAIDIDAARGHLPVPARYRFPRPPSVDEAHTITVRIEKLIGIERFNPHRAETPVRHETQEHSATEGSANT